MLCAICVGTGEHVGIVTSRATGCNSAEQPFHYHGLLNMLTWCLCREPEHIWILVVVSSCLWFLREELRSAGVSNTSASCNSPLSASCNSPILRRRSALFTSDYAVTNVITRTSPIEISQGQRQCACSSCRSFGREAYNELTR